MKKPRLGTNDWGTDDREDEQGFFDLWVTRDERNAHHEGDLPILGFPGVLSQRDRTSPHSFLKFWTRSLCAQSLVAASSLICGARFLLQPCLATSA
jgi:hypothetical protein